MSKYISLLFALLVLSVLLVLPVSAAEGVCDGCSYGLFNGTPACLSGGGVHICQQNFPDDFFRFYVQTTFDANKDSVMDPVPEGFDTMSLSAKGIASLKGIEFFPMLRTLNCESNKLTELDLSGNPNLQYLHCSNNHLATLDLSENPNLLLVEASGQLLNDPVVGYPGSGSNNHFLDLLQIFYADELPNVKRIIQVSNPEKRFARPPTVNQIIIPEVNDAYLYEYQIPLAAGVNLGDTAKLSVEFYVSCYHKGVISDCDICNAEPVKPPYSIEDMNVTFSVGEGSFPCKIMDDTKMLAIVLLDADDLKGDDPPKDVHFKLTVRSADSSATEADKQAVQAAIEKSISRVIVCDFLFLEHSITKSFDSETAIPITDSGGYFNILVTIPSAPENRPQIAVCQLFPEGICYVTHHSSENIELGIDLSSRYCVVYYDIAKNDPTRMRGESAVIIVPLLLLMAAIGGSWMIYTDLHKWFAHKRIK